MFTVFFSTTWLHLRETTSCAAMLPIEEHAGGRNARQCSISPAKSDEICYFSSTDRRKKPSIETDTQLSSIALIRQLQPNNYSRSKLRPPWQVMPSISFPPHSQKLTFCLRNRAGHNLLSIAYSLSTIPPRAPMRKNPHPAIPRSALESADNMCKTFQEPYYSPAGFQQSFPQDCRKALHLQA